MKEELLKEIREITKRKYDEIKKSNDKKQSLENIFYEVFKSNMYKIRPDETNKIFVERGTFIEGQYDPILGIQNSLVSREDTRADYRGYRDLEQLNDITVPIKECADFEKNNSVINCSFYESLELYYAVRKDLITLMMNDSQEEAAKAIKRMYIRKK